jgi:hypothetical protein
MKWFVEIPVTIEDTKTVYVVGPIEAHSRTEAVAQCGITVWTEEEWNRAQERISELKKNLHTIR